MEVSLSGGGSASFLTITNEFNLFSENTLLKGMKSFSFDPINDKLVEKEIEEKSLWDYICDGASYIGDKVGDFVDSVAGHVVAGLCVVGTIAVGVFYVASVFASGGATIAFLPEILAFGTFAVGSISVINKGLSDSANNQVSSYSDYLFEGVMGSAKGLLAAESVVLFGGLGLEGLDLFATSSFVSGGLNSFFDQGVRTGTVDFEKVAEDAIFEATVGALTYGAIKGAGAVASAFKGAAGNVTGATKGVVGKITTAIKENVSKITGSGKAAVDVADDYVDDIAKAADDAAKVNKEGVGDASTGGAGTADDIAKGGSKVIKNKLVDIIKNIRSKLPNTNLSKRGNMAVAEVDIPGVKDNFIAHSKINTVADKGADVADFSCLKSADDRIFTSYVEDQFPRYHDTEAKILEDIASQIKDPNVSGTINLYSELPCCQSCSNIILEFKRMFPNIKLNVYVE